MNRLARFHQPYPTTIYRLVGDADDFLAFHKFSVFALVSSLFSSRASSAFRTTLRNEGERKKRHARFVRGYYQKRRREFDQFGKGERELERLLDMIESRLFFLHQPRTVDTIPDTRPPFNPPHWTGDSAEGLTVQPLPESSVLTAADALHLVRDLGYDAQAAFASMPRQLWMNAKADRRRFGVVGTEDGRWLDRTNIAQPIPYVAAATRHTKQGFLSRHAVLRAVARMRTNDNMRMAVVEVVFRRQSPTTVAKKFRLNLETLKKYSTRVRQRISGDSENSGKPNEIEAFERELSTLLT
jgi:hypothetical protein